MKTGCWFANILCLESRTIAIDLQRCFCPHPGRPMDGIVLVLLSTSYIDVVGATLTQDGSAPIDKSIRSCTRRQFSHSPRSLQHVTPSVVIEAGSSTRPTPPPPSPSPPLPAHGRERGRQNIAMTNWPPDAIRDVSCSCNCTANTSDVLTILLSFLFFLFLFFLSVLLLHFVFISLTQSAINLGELLTFVNTAVVRGWPIA